MGTESSPGDPEPTTESVAEQTEGARRLALLWEPHTTSTLGRKPRLSLDEVVDAAMDLVGEAGLDALTMRSVAGRLGVGAMSLYTYVPGRAELVDLMIDRAYASLRLPSPDSSWRPALELYVRQLFGLFQRHPWIVGMNRNRLPLAPRVLDAEEAGLRTLIDTGLTEQQTVELLELVNGLIWGLASTAAREAAEHETTGQGYGEYWQDRSWFWNTYFDAERYPTMTRAYLAGAFNEGSDFDRVLERLLDSVEYMIDHTVTERAD
ncbi:TetR/AcrR family transcriptional regulator [Brevibacterium picturae]|uniref:TetR/AcrR family transcriptional regulator n=2 Tax=Brevibacterium picturae TaxID=260553 RepID=A0ABN2CPT7_9MICO